MGWLAASGRLRADALSLRPDGAEWMVHALVLFSSGLMLGVWRFHVLLRGATLRLPWRDAFRVGMIGQFFGLVGPGGVGGDLVRTGYAMAASGQRAAALAAALMDRYVGVLGLSMVASVASGWAWPLLRDIPAARVLAAAPWGLTAAMTVGLALAAAAGPGFHAFLTQRAWPGTRTLSRLVDALSTYRRTWLLWLAGLSMAVAMHGLFALGFVALGRALSTVSSPPPLAMMATASPLALLVNGVPMPGGGLGVGEAAFDQLLRWLSDDAITGGAALFLAYRVVTLPFNLTGCLFFLRGRALVERSRRAYAEESTDADDTDASSRSL